MGRNNPCEVLGSYKILALAILLGLLAGCGGQGGQEFDDGEPETEAATGSDRNAADGSESGTNGSVDDAAQQLFLAQCANCHGENGEGGTAGGELYACETCGDFDILYSRILDTMPLGNPQRCGEDCSGKLAHYILSDFVNEAGIPPETDLAAPIVDYSRSAPLSGDAPLNVTFDASLSSASSNIKSYAWDFGDGDSGSGVTAEHMYTMPDTYVVTVTITDDNDLSSTARFVVEVLGETANEPPTPAFTQSATSAEAPATINFNASGSSDDMGIAAYRWDFGDGTTDNGGEVQHTFTQAGSYEVALSVIDIMGATSTATATVAITAPMNNSPPTARLNVTGATAGMIPLDTEFNAEGSNDADGSLINYVWSFGDGSAPVTRSSADSVTHRYTQPGDYTVKLTVFDDGMLSDSETITINAESQPDNKPPIANAKLSRTLGLAPLAVTFDSSASSDDKAIAGYTWVFGDGGTSSSRNPTHTYTDAGSYDGSLTLTDSDGATNTTPFSITVQSKADVTTSIYQSQCASCHGNNGQGVGANPALTIGRSLQVTSRKIEEDMPPLVGINCGQLDNCATYVAQYILDNFARSNTAPTANASASSNTNGVAPLNVQLDASRSDDDHGRNALIYRWDFGDGSNGVGATANHPYGAGAYTATLTVIDEEGLSDTDTVVIEVTKPAVQVPPTAQASVSPQSGPAPLTATFGAAGSSAGSSSITNYQWSFSNNTTANGRMVNRTFNTPGAYSATLTVTDANGLQNSNTVQVTVTEPQPEAKPKAAELYQAQCSQCHGSDGQIGGHLTIGKPLNVLTNIIDNEMPPTTNGINCGSGDQRVENCAALVAQYILDNFVRDNEAPVADASASSNTSGEAPLRVSFSSTRSSDDHGRNNLEFFWNFGDGQTSYTANPTHTYSTGNYTATLTVTDQEGESDTDTMSIVAQEPIADTPPTADASASPQTGPAPLQVTFSGNGSAAGSSAITTYHWNFGNGTTATGQTTTQTLTTPGTYAITLTVTDADNRTDTDTIQLVVTEAQELDVANFFEFGGACAICHGAGGQGGAAPAISGASYFRDALTSVVGAMVEDRTSGCGAYGDCVPKLVDYIFDNLAQEVEVDDFTSFSCTIPEPSTSAAKRLSKKQFKNALEDLLRFTSATQSQIAEVMASANHHLEAIADDEDESGFDQIDARVSEYHVPFHVDAVIAYASSINDNNSIRNAFIGESCSLSNSDCRARFIDRVGERILRRAVTDSDRNFYGQINDPVTLITTMLLSPDFMYRMELNGQLVSGRSDLNNLTDHEVASKLSFLFWNSIPDQNLLDAVHAGRIQNDYANVVEEIFNDPKTRANTRRFYDEWLKLTHIPQINIDSSPHLVELLPIDYGTSGDTSLPVNTDMAAYRQAAIDELLALTEYYTWETPGNIADLFTTQYSFARSPSLAKAYGVSAWNGDFDNLVQLPEFQHRGIFTRTALQMYGSVNSRPVLKGARIRKEILCDDVPLPANNALPDSVVIEKHFTTRERTVATTEVEGTTCRGCHHEYVNPPGYATEDYDSLGRFRDFELVIYTKDSADDYEIMGQFAINSQADLLLSENNTKQVNNGSELGESLLTANKVQACFARKMFRFSNERMEDLDLDGCTLQQIMSSATDGTLADTFKSIALQPQFKQRKYSSN